MDIWIFLPAPWHSESYIGFCRIKIPELLKMTWPRPCYKCFLRRTPPFYHSTIKSTWLPHQITLKGLTMSWSQKPWKPFRFGLVLLMEEIQANQLIWQISRYLQGFTDIRTGAVFLPSTISSEIQGNFPSWFCKELWVRTSEESGQWYPQFPQSKNKKFIFGQKRNGSIVVLKKQKNTTKTKKKRTVFPNHRSADSYVWRRRSIGYQPITAMAWLCQRPTTTRSPWRTCHLESETLRRWENLLFKLYGV